jgi:branched-chain amino acid transport system permease protein
MSVAYQYYLITLLVYFGVNTIACWALNLQYGVGGVLNFAFIMFQAVGAYIAGVLTLGPSTGLSFQQYILGASLPFPLPWPPCWRSRSARSRCAPSAVTTRRW